MHIFYFELNQNESVLGDTEVISISTCLWKAGRFPQHVFQFGFYFSVLCPRILTSGQSVTGAYTHTL
jgi:hypothetical protein